MIVLVHPATKAVYVMLLVLLAGLPCGMLFAEEADPFDTAAFNTEIKQGTDNQQKDLPELLAGLTLLNDTTLLLPNDADYYGSSSEFYGKAFAKLSKANIGALFVSYNFRHFIMAASNDNDLSQFYARQSPDLWSIAFSLSEFHLSFDVDKKVFLRLGNQLLDWGASYYWSPADFVNRQATQSGQLVDTRAGKPGLRVHVPLDGANFFLFGDVSKTIAAGMVSDAFASAALGYRADVTLGGFNIGTVGYFGKTAPYQVGFTVSGAIAGFDTWSEYGMRVPAFGNEFTWDWSVGLERSFGELQDWTMRFEFFYHDAGRNDTNLFGIGGATTIPLYIGKYYVYGALVKKDIVSGKLGAGLTGVVNLSDASFKASGSLDFTLPGIFPFSFLASYRGGQTGREFTLPLSESYFELGARLFIQL